MPPRDDPSTRLAPSPLAPPPQVVAVAVVGRRMRRRRGGAGPAGILALLLVVVVVAMGKVAEPTPHTRGEIVLLGATDRGAHPFTASVLAGRAEAAPAKASTASGSSSTPAGAQLITETPGSQPGLYGATRGKPVCDAHALATALRASEARVKGYQLVEGISDVASFINTLTGVVLRRDTRVTDHGFITDHATVLQAVLQAGTAVMVDQTGVPKVRCLNGDPLTDPIRIQITPKYLGTRWTGFVPAGVTVVTAAAQPLTALVLTDTSTGQRFSRPAQSSGQADADAPAAPQPAS